MSEKTEQPTPRRLEESRKKGELPKSRLLGAAAATAGGLLGLSLSVDVSAARLLGWTARLFSTELEPQVALTQAVTLLALAAAPVLGGAMFGALAASLATAGLRFAPAQLAPKLERISPQAGFGRLFSMQSLIELGKGIVAALVVAACLWSGLEDVAGSAFKAPGSSGIDGLIALLHGLAPAVTRAVVVLVLLGVADFALAKRRHLKGLMMTKEEVKQEHKQVEGDPRHKAKRKQLHKQISQGGAARGLHKATAIVVNPTHIAVALRYAPHECEAPYLVAKAREADALALKAEAKRLGIPVVRDIPLARSLIHYEVGEEVPEELYRAAAAVLRVAMEANQAPTSP